MAPANQPKFDLGLPYSGAMTEQSQPQSQDSQQQWQQPGAPQPQPQPQPEWQQPQPQAPQPGQAVAPVQQAPAAQPDPSIDGLLAEGAPKYRILAGILALTLGIYGVHNFYLGNRDTATAQLLTTLISLILSVVVIGAIGILVVAVWSLFNAYQIFTGATSLDGYGRPLR